MSTLRKIGTALLALIIVMALYGSAFLMPHLVEEVHSKSALAQGTAPQARLIHNELIKQILLNQAYWGVCGLLVVGLIIVALLDWQRVNRIYYQEKASLMIKTAREAQQNAKTNR